MPAINLITAEKLFRLIGTPRSPAIVDVRPLDDVAGNPSLIPGAVWRDGAAVADWAARFQGRSTVVVCAHGGARSQGVSAWLRQSGSPSEVLEGGFEAWIGAGQPIVPQAVLPPRNANGQTVWVTRARPKVDRIACPWLIRRFVDPDAVFLFVPTSEVVAVATRFGGAPFDIDAPEIVWGHEGERCTFDTMVGAFGLGGMAPLVRLAAIVRGADTGRPDLVPEAAGLLAISLGLSRMYADDAEQLEAGMGVYDALYRWSRDATDEVHNWTSHKPAGAKAPK